MRVLHSALVACLMASTLFSADNPFLGTWKLNAARSKSSPGPPPKELTVKFDMVGEKVRRKATGVDGDGKPIAQGGKDGDAIMWDGKDHPVTSPPGQEMTVAVKRVNDHTSDVTVKQNGKVMVTIRSVVSKDGKTMTNTANGVNEKGEKIHGVEVLDKQ
jgi:hypothetical protein